MTKGKQMDIYLEVMKSLVEIVKQGGVYGLWGLGIFLVINLVRIIAVLWVVYNLGKLIMSTIVNIFTIKCCTYKDKIALLSKDSQKGLEETLINFSKDMKEATDSFLKESADLLKKSEEK